MIVAKLIGGLGNQMFQYAFGRYLAIKYNTELLIDVAGFKNTNRSYGLDVFEIDCAIVDLISKEGFVSYDHNMMTQVTKNILFEKGMGFNREAYTVGDNVVLQGYWQSEKYFSTIAPVIRNDFKVRLSASDQNRETLAQIKEITSVCVHIRRGDMAYDPKIRDVHGLIPLTYYKYCMQQMVVSCNDPHFFIFTDDPIWVMNHTKVLSQPFTIIYWNQFRDYDDFRLMQNCKHHIIANSTFSWWSAWLCNNPDKIVVVPKQWIQDESRINPDLIPNEWVVVDKC